MHLLMTAELNCPGVALCSWQDCKIKSPVLGVTLLLLTWGFMLFSVSTTCTLLLVLVLPVMYEQTVCTRYDADIFLALYLASLDLRKESPVNLCTYEC